MSESEVIFITGANTGLGYEVVKALCQSDESYEIILGSRKIENGENAISQLKQEVSDTISTLSVVQADLESDDSIKQALETIASRFGKLDALVNNAGAVFDGKIQDGTLSIREAWQKSWDTNVAGTQVLTTMAMPLLLKSSNPRLMFITSGTSALAEPKNFETKSFAAINASPAAGWPKPEVFNPVTCYRSSKTGLNMLMKEWHRILKNDGVKVWAISPGFLATALGGIGLRS